MYCQIRFDILYCFAVFFVILISVSNISPRIIMKRKIHGRRNQTTRYLRQKRCWKFPQKREHERWGKVWYTPSLKLFTFRTLKILWFNCFGLEKHTCMYCQIRFRQWYFVLFCSVFYYYFDFSKQHFTKDNNEKKRHGRRNETTFYLRQKRYWKFPQKREHNTSTSLRGSSLFWGSRETRRECEGRPGWEARSLAINGELASRLNFNRCLSRYSFSWQIRSTVEP